MKPFSPASGARVQGVGCGAWVVGFGVWGVGFGFWVLGFGVWGVGFGVWGLGFGVWGVRFRVWGLGVGARDSGFRVQGFSPSNSQRSEACSDTETAGYTCSQDFGFWGFAVERVWHM